MKQYGLSHIKFESTTKLIDFSVKIVLSCITCLFCISHRYFLDEEFTLLGDGIFSHFLTDAVYQGTINLRP